LRVFGVKIQIFDTYFSDAKKSKIEFRVLSDKIQSYKKFFHFWHQNSKTPFDEFYEKLNFWTKKVLFWPQCVVFSAFKISEVCNGEYNNHSRESSISSIKASLNILKNVSIPGMVVR